MKRQPIRGQIYTYKQIVEDLILRGRPQLTISSVTINGSVQYDHVTQEQMLEIPNWSISKWFYQHTTSKLVPVFHFHHCEGPGVRDLVDGNPVLEDDGLMREDGSDWITPKGYSIPQNNKL